MSVLNSSIMQSSATVSASNTIDMEGCTISGANFTQKTMVTIDMTQAQNAVQSTDTQNSLKNEIQQQAEQITQALSLNPKSADVANITKNITNLASQLSNTVSSPVALYISLFPFVSSYSYPSA